MDFDVQRGSRCRRAFTLVELLIVMAVVVGFTAWGGSIMSSQVSYFRVRSGIESVPPLLKQACLLARAAGDPARRFGVALLPSGVAPGLSPGWYALGYRIGPTTPTHTTMDRWAPRPLLAALAGQSTLVKAAARKLASGLELARPLSTGQVGTTFIASPIFLEFDERGRLDGRASSTSALGIEANQDAGPDDDSFTLDLVDPASGFMRLRVASSGAVSISGWTSLGALPVIGGEAF